MRSVIAVVVLAGLVVPVVVSVGAWGLAVPFVMIGAVAVFCVYQRRAPGRGSVPLGFIIGVLLCGLTPFAFVALTPGPPPGAWVGALLIAIAAGFRLAWLVGQGAQRLGESMVWTFIYVFLGLAPLVQLRTAVDPATTPPVNHQLDATALSIVGLGTAAFAFGVWCARSADIARQADQRPATVRPQRVAVLILVGLVSATYYISQVGLTSLFSTRFELARAAQEAWGNPTTVAIVYAFAFMPLLVGFVSLQWWRALWPAAGGWLSTGALPLLTGAVLLVVVNPIGNPRYTSGTVYLAVLASLGLVATRARFRAVCVGFVAALILVFPLADAFRSTSTPGLEQANPVAALTTGDFDAYAQVVNTVQYVEERGLAYGYQALGPVMFWIPRTVWPEKPVDTGILLAESRGHPFTNLSAPLWAELFINGGWPLLVAGMFVFGMLIRRWDAGMIRTLRRFRLPGLLACILPFYLLIMLRGSLLQATSGLAVIVLSAWFVKDRRKPGAAVSEQSPNSMRQSHGDGVRR